MKKIKLLIASMIGAIALVFAAVLGINVKAATLTETYNFDITQFADDADESVANVVDGHHGTLVANGTDDSTKQMSLVISAEVVGSSGIYYSDSNTDLRVNKTSTASNLRFSFAFITEGDAVISFQFNSSGGSKNVEYWVDDATSATGSFAAGSLTAKSINVTGAGEHTISWHGTSTTTSDVKFKDISVLDHYEKDVTTYDVTLDYGIEGVDNLTTPVQENGKFTLPVPTHKLLGSEFLGWKSSIDDITYDSNTEIGVVQDVTFTAQWKSYELGDETVFNASDAETGTYKSNTIIINHSIFTVYATSDKSVSIEGTSITGANNESFTKKMVLGGKSTLTGTKARCIGFTAPTDGIVKVQFVTGSNGKSRSAQVFDSSSTSTALASASNSNSTVATEFSANVEKGKSYLVGSNTDTIVLLYVSFEATEPAPAIEVTALQQEAVVGDSTFVRFIFIVSNDAAIDEYDFTNALHLCLDDENNGPVVDRTPKAYYKLTLGGEAYTSTVKGENYTFDNSVNSNDIYVVYVVEFTTAKYAGHTISADLEYRGTTYSTTPYTFA